MATRWIWISRSLSTEDGRSGQARNTGDEALVGVEPYYVRWNVSASPVSVETATFTVNNVTARQRLGAYEPVNLTNEAGVKVGFHF